jgi:hypothetical protein
MRKLYVRWWHHYCLPQLVIKADIPCTRKKKG